MEAVINVNAYPFFFYFFRPLAIFLLNLIGFLYQLFDWATRVAELSKYQFKIKEKQITAFFFSLPLSSNSFVKSSAKNKK